MPTQNLKALLVEPLLKLEADVHRATGTRPAIEVTVHSALYDELCDELVAPVRGVDIVDERVVMGFHNDITIGPQRAKSARGPIARYESMTDGISFEVTGPPLDQISPGLYRLEYKTGGTVLAAVGPLLDGGCWFAPVDAASATGAGSVSTDWSGVRGATRIDAGANSVAAPQRVTELRAGLTEALDGWQSLLEVTTQYDSWQVDPDGKRITELRKTVGP